MKKLFIACCAVLFLITNADANDIVELISTVENWIDKSSYSQMAKNYEKGKLQRIIASDITDAEKIKLLKEKFPKAFQQELISPVPIFWRIHSLSLGYDIEERATSSKRTVNISEILHSNRSSNDWTQKTEKSSSHRINAGVSTDVNLSLNPLNWLNDLSKSKINLSGSYAYGRNTAQQTSEIWSKSQQELFTQKSSMLAEIMSQTDIKNFHLTFTLTITNNGNDTAYCYLKGAYIPVKRNDGGLSVNATPHGMPELLEIPSGRTVDIKFRAELNNTAARELVVYMGKNAPSINILNGGNFPVKTRNGEDLIAKTLNRPKTVTVEFQFPEFFGSWDILRSRKFDGKAVTLKEALQAISNDFAKAGVHNIVTWSNGDLTAVSSVPFDGFFPNDKEYRYMAFLQIADKVYSEIGKKILDEPIPETGCKIVIIDCNKLSDYQNSHIELQKAIYEKIKEEAGDGMFNSKSNPSAQYLLAQLYGTGFYVKQNIAEKNKWIRKAADKDYAKAQVSLANYYWICKDYKEAFDWYKKAAKQDNAQAQNYLGWCYYHGQGVDKDYYEAVKWYKEAADKDHAGAQINLGDCYYFGNGVNKDYYEAVKWYKKAVEKDHIWAQFMLGECYYRGNGVTQDYDEAVKWYKKAADKDNTWAQYNLGVCYYFGNGVTKNYYEAVRWYKIAAEKDHTGAQAMLGVCYYFGNGVNKDYDEAVKWYKKAADKDHAMAQLALGDCYYWGHGVTKDYDEAVKWYKKAADNGNEKAKLILTNRCNISTEK